MLGVGLKLFGDYKNRQLDLQLAKINGELELAKRDKDAQIMAQEWAGRTRVAEVEAAGKADVAASEAFAESFKTEPQRYSDNSWLAMLPPWARVVCAILMFVLDWVRGACRPGLAIYLAVLTTLIFYEARALLDGPLPAEVASQLVLHIINTILYLFVTCVTWYYGVRNLQTPPKA